MFSSFHKSFKELKHRSKERSEYDEDWALFITRLANYSYVFSGVPLPFNSPAVFPSEFLDTLKRNFRRLSLAPGDLVGQAEDVLRLLDGLILLAGNPLFSKLQEAMRQLPRVRQQSIVIAKTKYLSATQQFVMSHFPDMKVVTPQALCGSTCYDRLFLIGSPHWYPAYIFDSPRAMELHAVCYEWMHFPPNVECLFSGQDRRLLPPSPTASTDILDFIHRRAISRFITEHQEESEAEEVSARLFLLDAEKAVFLENDDMARAYVLDLQETIGEDEDSKIERIPVQDIQPGMFVLLRTSGGGDYIPEVADIIMGLQAAEARRRQQFWKQRLAALVRDKGLSSVVKSLRTNGSKIANPTNLRNWVSHRNIKTSDRNDFEAIMRLIALERESDELWSNAEFIDSAHRSAGKQIRRMLLEEVNKSDLTELANSGYMEFRLELNGMAGGSLAAFRVLSLSRETHPVPYYKIARPFSLEEDLWLE